MMLFVLTLVRRRALNAATLFTLLASAFLVFALLVRTSPAAYAAGTGQMSGSVTDAKTGAAIRGAAVNAVWPSDRYRPTTDDRGNFSLAGVAIDTYTISVERQGYDIFALTGATVTQAETFRVSGKLAARLQNIASVRARARSITSAFQPDQTVDTTAVNEPVDSEPLGYAMIGSVAPPPNSSPVPMSGRSAGRTNGEPGACKGCNIGFASVVRALLANIASAIAVATTRRKNSS